MLTCIAGPPCPPFSNAGKALGELVCSGEGRGEERAYGGGRSEEGEEEDGERKEEDEDRVMYSKRYLFLTYAVG